MRTVPLARSLDTFVHERGESKPYPGARGLVRRLVAGAAAVSMIASGVRRRDVRGVALALMGADLLCYAVTRGDHLYDLRLLARHKHAAIAAPA